MRHRPKELCQLAGVWGGDVPEHGLMWEEKRDGWRALYLPDHEGRPTLFTRNGVPIGGTEHILWKLGQMEAAAGERMVFDGEFVVGDDDLVATKAWCESGWRQGGCAGTFHVFDVLTHAEWKAGGSDRPLVERKAMLRALFEQADGDDWTCRPGSHGRDDDAPAVVVLPDGWAFEATDVLAEARRIWAAEGEGVMLKSPEAPYRRNRSSDWLKVKPGGPWAR